MRARPNSQQISTDAMKKILCLRKRTESENVSVKNIVTEYLENATTHGISSIYRTTRVFPRLFWIAAVISFLCIFVMSIPRLVTKMTDYGHVTREDGDTQMTMPFPAVTMCNANPIKFNVMDKMLKKYFPNVTDWSYEMYETKAHELMVMSLEFNETERVSLGEEAEHFFFADKCLFGSRKCHHKKDFYMTSNVINGNCFTFNHNGSLIQQRVGVEYGLTLILNVAKSDYNIYVKNSELSPIGAYITIHNPGFVPHSQSQAFLVTPNHLARVAIQKKSIKRLKHPYSDNCTDGNTDVRAMHPTNYTVSLCTLFCSIYGMFDYCGVVDVKSAHLAFHYLGKKYNVSTTYSDKECLQRFEAHFASGNMHCDCPNVCFEESYSQSISTAIWPSDPELDHHIEKMKEKKHVNVSRKMYKENFVAIQLYYNNFNVQGTEHLPAYVLPDFFSDLGGALGLWIGGSFLSLLEFGAMLMDILRAVLIWCTTRKTTKKANINKPTH